MVAVRTSRPVSRTIPGLTTPAAVVLLVLALVTSLVVVLGPARRPAGDAVVRPAGAVQRADVRQLVQASAIADGKLLTVAMVDGQVPGTPLSLWRDPKPECSWCAAGPAVATAALAARTGDPYFAKVAIQTLDATVATVGVPSGAGADTAFLAAAIGTTAVFLGDELDAAHRRRWTAAVVAAATALDENGDDEWYANGNVALANVLVFLTASRLTGDPRWTAAYRRSLAFTVSPDERFPGRGLVVTRNPARADAGDGAGYLTEEQPPRPPGFDPEYSLTQLSLLVQLDLVSGGDRTVRRLLNLVANQLRPRVDTTGWTVDLGGGSRRPQPHVWSYTSSAWPYLASRGRDDLATYAPAAAAAAMADLRKNARKDQPGLRYVMGGVVAGLVL